MATQESSIPQPGFQPTASSSGPPGGASANRGRRLIIAGVALAALAAAVAVVSVLMTGGTSTAATRIAIQEVINRVESDRPRDGVSEAGNFLPATIGQDLAAGDEIKTYEASEARVDISVGDFVRVSRTKPNTLWRLGEYSVENGTVIELERGKIFLFDDASETDPQPITVVTPAGSASPRGTWLSFSFDPVSEVAELQCFRGTCVLENDFGKEVLVDEQKTTVTQKAAPLTPVEMTDTETETFEALPEVSTGELTIPTPGPIRPQTAAGDRALPTEGPTPSPVASPAPAVGLGAGESGSNRGQDPEEPNRPLPLDPVRAPVIAPTRGPTATPTLSPTSTPVFRPRPSPTFVPALRPSPTPRPQPTAVPEPVSVSLPPVNSQVLPHVFVGTAILDGRSAPEGTVVTAWMRGFSEPLATTEVSGGSLTLLVPQYGPGSMEGRTVEFRLNGRDAKATAVWAPGGADILVLEATSTGRP